MTSDTDSCEGSREQWGTWTPAHATVDMFPLTEKPISRIIVMSIDVIHFVSVPHETGNLVIHLFYYHTSTNTSIHYDTLHLILLLDTTIDISCIRLANNTETIEPDQFAYSHISTSSTIAIQIEISDKYNSHYWMK